MSSKHEDTDVQAAVLKNEFSRQRWELFHRAISHAKQSNQASMEDAELAAAETKPSGPILSIVR